MLTWLSANIGTIIAALAVLLLVYGVVRVMINDKKRGGSSCGCGCSACAMREQCKHGK